MTIMAFMLFRPLAFVVPLRRDGSKVRISIKGKSCDAYNFFDKLHQWSF
jgi:hypothetical protein